VQRNLAGLFFLLAAIAWGIGAGSWWLQYTAFTPDDTVGATEAILNDDEIRAEITTIVSAATATTLEQTPGEVAALVNPLIGSRAGAAVMTDIVRDSHGRAIGVHDEPVRITGDQMVLIVRDEAVADLQPVTLPVAEVSTLRFLANSLGWVAAIMGVIGLIVLLLGIVARPERPDVARGVGEMLVSLAIAFVVFGLLIPVFVLPGINDTTWAGSVPRLAMRTLPLVTGISVVFAALGALLMVKSAGSGRRKQWSTPLSVSRYRDDRSWS